MQYTALVIYLSSPQVRTGAVICDDVCSACKKIHACDSHKIQGKRDANAVEETDSLQGLTRLARRKRDTSARQLAIQAQSARFKIVGTTLNQIENGTYKSMPSAETIRAIAWLAGVTDAVAFAAARRPTPGPPFSRELPEDVDQLSPKRRKVALEVLRALIEAEQQEHELEQVKAADNVSVTEEATTVVQLDPRAHRTPPPKPDDVTQEEFEGDPSVFTSDYLARGAADDGKDTE